MGRPPPIALLVSTAGSNVNQIDVYAIMFRQVGLAQDVSTQIIDGIIRGAYFTDL
jgi:hypothetical protein